MAYALYLDGRRLPVTPRKIELSIQNRNKTVELIDDGQVNLLKTPGLTDVSFEAMLPQYRYPFAVYGQGFHRAEYYASKLRSLRNTNKRFRFILTRTTPGGDFLSDVNLLVTLEDCSFRDDTEEGQDLLVSLKLRQYRDYGTKWLKVKSSSTYLRRSTDSAPDAKTHKVIAGDCLWAIAQAKLGDGSRYPELYQLNRSLIDGGNRGTGNPKYTIYPGQIFQLPAK